ncbi:hypothetical protein T11_7182 [Trichinella zimbabwensis]|uniref:Uncharacterized protein n=1 Tax=Trichinella zimbabwensis TaxID=268475 RepID=A0A0V1DPL9_9BILA|nr:hypothetical protein T11_7182 [Trichinella zimbabwensis]
MEPHLSKYFTRRFQLISPKQNVADSNNICT